MGEEEGSVFRNMYEGHMHKTKVGRIESGRWGWLEWAGVVGGNGDNCK